MMKTAAKLALQAGFVKHTSLAETSVNSALRNLREIPRTKSRKFFEFHGVLSVAKKIREICEISGSNSHSAFFFQ
jgi:hypothetical protein